MLDRFYLYITCSELFSNVLGIIKFKFSLFGLSFSILTFFKLALYFLIFLLVIYILFLEKYENPEVKSELPNHMLQSAFFSTGTRATLTRLTVLTTTSIGLISGALSLQDRFKTNPNLQTFCEELLKKISKLKEENKNSIQQNNELRIRAQDDSNSGVALATSVNDWTKSHNVSLNNMDTYLVNLENALNKGKNAKNDSEKEAAITEINSILNLLKSNKVELERNSNILSSLTGKFNQKFEEAAKLEESSKNNSSDNNSSSDSNSGSSLRSAPILSTLESEKLISLSELKEVIICYIVMNGLILTSTVNIIFTLFGEYLINRFSLESRFPKLAKLIALRRKFQSYYLKINFSIIIVDVLIQISVYLFILSF